jgi:hypothetical protein
MLKLSKTVKKSFAASAAILTLIVIGTVFSNRDPVLIISDEAFNLIYGKQRLLVKSLITEARLFRPVKQVLIGGNAGGDLVSLAVQGAAKNPYCVLFPYRYSEGAAYYAKEMPGIPVVVLGRADQKAPEEVLFIQTDIETDLYRAGICAALLAQNSDGIIEEKKNGITVLQRKNLTDGQRQVFQQGAQERGFQGTAEYFLANTNYRTNERTAAVVVLGAANSFFDQNTKLPVVLVSWLDPQLTSSWVKVIFDDSPWALAIPAVKLAEKGEGGTLPSQARVIGSRIGSGELRRKLGETVRNFQKSKENFQNSV